MGKDRPTLEKHLRKIAQTEFIPRAPKHDQAHDLGGTLQPVEGRSRSLVEAATASRTAIAPITEFGPIRALRGFLGLTIWTFHIAPCSSYTVVPGLVPRLNI